MQANTMKSVVVDIETNPAGAVVAVHAAGRRFRLTDIVDSRVLARALAEAPEATEAPAETTKASAGRAARR